MAGVGKYDRRPPEPGELPALMADVFYEHDMFTIAAARIEDIAQGMWQAEQIREDLALGELGILRNAWVEVFLLHLRNLVDFYVSKPEKDNVVARHYVREWSATSGGASLKWLVDLAPVLNKRLAHITAYRRRVNKDMDAELVGEIRSRLIDVQQRWWALLSVEQRQWFAHSVDP